MKTKSLPAITRMVSEVEVTDFPATTVTYDYDAVSGQRARVEQAGGVNRTVRYAHDDLGRLRVKEMPEGTLTYMYDDLGAQTQITARSNYTGWAANPPYRFEDLTGSQASASSAEWNYAYDNLARLQKVNDDGSVADASYTYDAIGRLQTTGYRNGLTTSYTYNSRNWLRMLETRNASEALIARFDYDNAVPGAETWPEERHLSAVGQRRWMAEYVSGSSRTVDYDYDVLRRLTKETLRVASGPDPYISYTGSGAGTGYDVVGNRRSRTVSGTWPGVSPHTGHTFNERDLLNAGGEFSYDANGNTLTFTGTTQTNYIYDAENRLVKKTGNGDVTIEYDADGNRVSKLVGTVKTLYVVEDRNPTGYAQVMEEKTSLSGAAPTVTRIYIYGLDLISQKRIANNAIRYFGYDGLGSVRYLTEPGGSVTDTYTYDAFGIQIASTGVSINFYRYTGEQWDEHLGMYYLRARYYKPELGRFWTMDSYEGRQSDPLSLHKYLYAHANPVNGIDPSGKMSVIRVVVTVGIFAAVAIITYNHMKAKREVNDSSSEFHKTYAVTLSYPRKRPMFAYTIRGSNYEALGPAGKWIIDYHEKLHRDGDLSEVSVTWKQKDKTEEALISGIYGEGRILSDEDIQELVELWYEGDEAYHNYIGLQDPEEDLPARLRKKGISEDRLKELKLRDAYYYLTN